MRRVGKSLGIDPQLLGRHPFPGPGLAIRILGDITPEKVEILQNVDKIYIDALREWGLYDQVWQAGAILLPVKSVGVMGDERTYESCVALRAVASTDGMTADWVSAMLIGGTSFLTKNSLSKPKIRQSEILRISPIRSLQGDTHQERSNTNPGIPTSSVNMYITAKY